MKLPNRFIVLLLAFFSGTAALIEELGLFGRLEIGFGATHLTLAVITTAFLGGLAIGSLVGGKYADRTRRPLYLYGIFEILIGVSVIIATLILPGIIRLVYAVVPNYPDHVTLATALKFIVAIIVLLFPTVCMGATLPILIRSLARAKSTQGISFAAVYSVNTFGAVLGPMLAAFVLIPSTGAIVTIFIAAGINILIGVTAVLTGKNATLPEVWFKEDPGSSEDKKTEPDTSVIKTVSRYAFYAAFSGAAALIFEITWTKIFSLVIGSTVYSFALVLSAMLAGIAIGSAVTGIFVNRIKNSIFAFAIITFILTTSALAVAPIGAQTFFKWVVTIIKSGNGSMSGIAAVEFILIFLLMLIPTSCMGAVLTVLVHGASATFDKIGKRVGIIYAANTLGAILGSILAGTFLINKLSLRGSLIFAAMIGMLLVASAAFVCIRDRKIIKGIVSVVFAIVIMIGVVVSPSWDQVILTSAPYVYSELYSNPDDVSVSKEDIIFYKEGSEGVVSVHEDLFGYRRLRINGKIDATTHYDVKTQLLAGYLPTFFKPDAKTGLCVGLGAGLTLDAMIRGGIEKIDAVEISPEVKEALSEFANSNHSIHMSPNVNYYIDDARSFVKGTDRKYDIVVSVPSNPWIVGVSHLFTREFFRDVNDILNDDGIYVQWVQMYAGISASDFYSVIRTFREAFPNTILWEARLGHDYLLIGSRKELKIDGPWLLSLMAEKTNVSEDFRTAGIRTFPQIMAGFMMNGQDLMSKTPAEKANIITDNRNFLAYHGPGALLKPERSEIFRHFVDYRREPWDIISGEDIAGSMAMDTDACHAARQFTAKAKYAVLIREEHDPKYGKPFHDIFSALDTYPLEDEAVHIFFEEQKLREAWDAWQTKKYIECGWICTVDVIPHVPHNLEARWLLEAAKKGIPGELQDYEGRIKIVLDLRESERDEADAELFYQSGRGYFVLGEYRKVEQNILMAEMLDRNNEDVKLLRQLWSEATR